MSLPTCPITRQLDDDFAAQMQRAKHPKDPLRSWDGYYMGPTYKSAASRPRNTQAPRAER